MLRGRHTGAAACLLLSLGTAVILPGAPAAGTAQAAAAGWTPRVLSTDAVVRQLAQCGHTMYAVGHFRQVGQGGRTYWRRNAFSFDARTGAVTGWRPRVAGIVNSIALGPRCHTAYLGGKFDAVTGTQGHDLVAVGTGRGEVMRRFAHTTDGEVETLALVDRGRHLLVGGAFQTVNRTRRPHLASLNPATGAVDGYLRLPVGGRPPHSSGRSMVYNEQIAPSRDQLLIEGSFTHVGGQLRRQIAELRLGVRAATLSPWHNYQLNHKRCANHEAFYVRNAAFSPDERTIYLATTGRRGTSPFCDAVSALSNTSRARIEWVNKTGGDSLYAVAASSDNVYIAGHERWADNPQGHNSCGPGCVSRPGIGDVSPRTGRAKPWNPTRSRGHGADDLLITPAGLWVASDTYFGAVKCAHVYHPGICLLPGRA